MHLQRKTATRILRPALQFISVPPDLLEDGSFRVRNDYDHLSRRTAKHVERWYDSTGEWRPWETRTFVYDGWTPILETLVNHVVGTTNTVRYLWGLDFSETLQGAGGVGGLVAVIRDGATYFPSYDANGNITEYVSESGAVAAAYEYDPFGAIVAQSGAEADEVPFRFSTKYWDAETGLYYYSYRFYKPSIGRWINRDPIGEDGGENLYTFCKNSMFAHDNLGLYVNVIYDVEQKTLIATDVDTSETITLKEKVYSGNGSSCCVKADQWKVGEGPLPVGTYLIGLSYVPAQHASDSGDYNWYRLYGDNGKGGYTYDKIPVNTPDGITVYRGGFNLHTGTTSDGCVTVWSDVGRGDSDYPHSDDYDKLRNLIDKTKPLRYKNSNYSGWLEVK